MTTTKMKPVLSAMIRFFVVLLPIFITTTSGTPGATVRQYTVFRYQCPDKCLCVPDTQDQDLLNISCNWPRVQLQMFASFPRNVTSVLTIQCVTSSDSGLVMKSSLGSMAFKGFVKLGELRISDCAIDALPEDTFSGLTNLHTLSLNGLNKPQIDAKVFKKTPQLGRLSITKSGMKMLPSGALCSLKSLQILSLSNNKLGDIRLGIYDEDCQLENLVLLDVSWNQIRHIGSGDLRPFPKIRQLSAVGNRMDEIETQAFQSVPLIQHLDLESNLLRTTPALPDTLLHLNLADNRFENLPLTVANLENLVSLNLSHNEITPQTPFQLYSNHLESLDLSWNKFNKVPSRLFSNSIDILKQLWMSGNQLEELEPQFFSNFSNLQMLDLSGNRLKSLSEGIFDGLIELNDLKLANNTIYHVAPDVFRPLARQLQTLDMSGNRLAELPIALGRLARVRHIDFSRNQISKTYKFNLNKITHLTRLDLSNNHLETLESYVVADCPHLSDLNLRNNHLKELSSDAFQKCPQLRNLDLSQNELEDLSGALRDIRSLRHLNLTQNALKMLEWSEFPEDLISLSVASNKITLLGAVGRTRLRRLDIQNNKISLLLAEQFPETLEVLNISRNSLHQINEGTFIAMKQLKSVDLRENQVTKVSVESFASSSPTTSTIIRLYLSGNPLECSCESEWMRNATSKNHSPIQLNDFNQIQCRLTPKTHKKSSSQVDTFVALSNLRADDFVCEYKGKMCDEPGCICCSYDDCDCRSECPTDCRCFHDSSYRLNLVYCEANEDSPNSPPTFEIRNLPMHASHIHLRGIPFSTLKSHDLSGRGRLVELEINGTGLAKIESEALSKLTGLKSLSIVNNKLHHLNGTEFFNATNVKYVDLSNNRLGTLEPNVISTMFPDLEELKLNGNRFVDLPGVLENSTNKELKRVHLGTNPFRCDCTSRPNKYKIQEWIRENAEMVVDLRQVVCVENVTKALQTNDTAVFSDQVPNEGSDLFVMPIQEFLKANRTYCTKMEMGLFSSDPIWNRFLIFVLCTFMALFLFISIWTGISIIRRTRPSLKNPRYRKSTASSSLLNGTTVSQGGISPHPSIQFDIFVSYSQVDTEVVRNDLCIPLQNQNMLLLMLHNNDGDQYSAYTESRVQRVSDSLIQQMCSCHTLVWYLTQNFIQNEWNYVAIKTALRIFVQNRKKCVIVLLGEDVDMDQLEPELGQMLRRNIHVFHRSNSLWWNFMISAVPRRYDNSGDGTFGVDGEDNVSDTTQIYSDMYGTIVPSEVI